MDRAQKACLCGAAGEMGTLTETTEATELELEFRRLSLDELVVLACGSTYYVTAHQIEAYIAKMAGLIRDQIAECCKNLSRPVGNLVKGKVLEYLDEGSMENGTRKYALTDKGIQVKIEIFNAFVDSLPRPMLDAFLKKAQ